VCNTVGPTVKDRQPLAGDEFAHIESEVCHFVSKRDPHIGKETLKKGTSEKPFAVDEFAQIESEVCHFMSKKDPQI